jgi:trimeric autotransporter adhesin
MKTKNMTTLHLRKSISRSPLRLAVLLIPLALACFALSPTAQAQLPSPTPDGGYPGDNTAEGTNALFSLTTGIDNTASGFQALYSNTTGGFNTATGWHALVSNTGDFNTATGESALAANTTGGANAAFGEDTLASNTDGSWNTAVGTNALAFSTGSFNTASGAGTLFSNTTGHNNIALGWEAGDNLTTGAYNINIGNRGVAGESKTIRIGDVVATAYADGTHPAHTSTYIAGIMGKTIPKGTPVFINANGQLGTATSSARFKDEIKPMDKASEAILALKPVSFRYKKELDPEGIPQFGLVAEDVAKVNSDLVVRDAEGKVYTVRYDAVNAMLLNEFLKEHRTVQELKSTAAKQEAIIAHQQKQIEALATGLQKVSEQLELSKPAPRTVSNNQ